MSVSAEVGQHATTVHVRFFASARAAAGVESELLSLPAGSRVTDALAELRDRHPEGLPKVLEVSSYLLDGVAVRDVDNPLPDGAELDVLPPFAGG
ncbi:MoaD/ThiS family protein [Amycolatopsis suaedae]|uniref:Molybdopterin synthase sulfur carrier subunit n=1 Tax=Amycolatopsis suaedae TaxID=2510978 RepID=A0A4Q7J2V7_9PSEU|nr:MoaD/ThiS family protein [Amycolatopsis suaedae]RZQ61811.1 MoaD/ThiS family protein [Amycolatopsis suaedae]